MAIFHQSFQIIGKKSKISVKKNGISKIVDSKKSAVAAAAYRSGTRLVEVGLDADGKEIKIIHNYSFKEGVVHDEILAPENIERDGWVFNREALWNKVQKCENRIDAQYCREFDAALPIELSIDENIELIREYVEENFVSMGMIADLTVHNDNPDNPHAHVMLTMRELEVVNGEISFSKLKNRSWNDKAFIQRARKNWAATVNNELKLRGFEARISELSFKELGIKILPTRHEGPARYISNARIALENKQILQQNAQRIASDPDIVLQLINKTTFTKSDIEKVYSQFLIKDIDTTNIEGLNNRLVSHFLNGMEKILGSNQLVNLNVCDAKGNNLYAAQKQIELEQKYVDLVTKLSVTESHVSNDCDFDSSLSAQQQDVVAKILNAGDIAIVEGLPGAGKTRILKNVVSHFSQKDYVVFGAAPSAIAALNLNIEAGCISKTIAKYLYDWNLDRERFKCARTILIVDEMSMVDLPDMYKLLEEISGVGGKVILVGDTNQFGAIGIRGAASRAVDICGAFKLDEVRRQNNELQRLATKFLSNYELEEALNLYEKTDCLRFSQKDSIVNLAKDFALKTLNDKESNNIALAYSRKSIDQLNKQIRQELKRLGILRNEEYECNLTNKLFLTVGDKVVFTRNNKSLRVCNGDVGKILSFGEMDGDSHREIIVNVNDTIVKINTAFYNHLSSGYALTSHKAQGKTYHNAFVLYEKYMGYESFNVMMTRHINELKLYIDRCDLMPNIERTAIKKLFYRADDIRYLKEALLEKIGMKESNLFSLDYLEKQKINKVLEYVEMRNFVRSNVQNYHIDKFNKSIDAQIFLQNLKKRDDLAQELNTKFDEFKDHIAAARINMNEFNKINKVINQEHSLSNLLVNLQGKSINSLKRELNQWYKGQKLIKEKAIVHEAEIKVKQEIFDELSADANYLKELDKFFCQTNWTKNFKKPDMAMTALTHLEKNSGNKLNLYQDLALNPDKLAKLQGFSLLGLKTKNYQAASNNLKEYFLSKVLYSEVESKMQKYGDIKKLENELVTLKENLARDISLLGSIEDYKIAAELSKAITSNRLKDVAPKILLQPKPVRINQAQLTNVETKKAFLKFTDIKLDRADFEQIFHMFVRNLNKEDEILKLRNEIKCGSLQMNLDSGLWNRFSHNRGGNIFDFVIEATGCSKREALEIIASFKGYVVDAKTQEIFSPSLSSSNTIANSFAEQMVNLDDWTNLKHVPDGITLTKEKLHWIKQEIEDLYEYKDVNNKTIGYVVRLNENGKKMQLPLSYCTRLGKGSFRVKNFGAHIFGAEKIQSDRRTILFVEGEKTAIFAQQIFPEYAVMAVAGVNKIDQIKWDEVQLKDRNILIWPDNDKAGFLAAQKLQQKLGQNNIIKIIDVESLNLPEKWDLADNSPKDFDPTKVLNSYKFLELKIEAPGMQEEFKNYCKVTQITSIDELKSTLVSTWKSYLDLTSKNHAELDFKVHNFVNLELKLMNKTLENGDILDRKTIAAKVQNIWDRRQDDIRIILQDHVLIKQLEKNNAQILCSVAEQIVDHENLNGKGSICTQDFKKIIDNATHELNFANKIKEYYSDIFYHKTLALEQIQDIKDYGFNLSKLVLRFNYTEQSSMTILVQKMQQKAVDLNKENMLQIQLNLQVNIQWH